MFPYQIFFDNVRIPKKFMIGKEGMGFTYQMLQFQEERLFAAVGGTHLLIRYLSVVKIDVNNMLHCLLLA